LRADGYLSEARRILRQALVIGALGLTVAAAVHFSLIKRFVRGEFRESFFQAAEYPGVRMITLAEAEDLWAAGEALVIDARAGSFYAQGHVPRARNIPADGSGSAIPREILDRPGDMAIVVYCEGGTCQSSLALAKRLHDEGFKDIRVFSGGWEEWTKAGLPEEKGDGQE
jgi:rhodanese-related sulfurtransferase